MAVTRILGEKAILAGEVVNFAVDWTDWLDTTRDGTADTTLSSATWSVVGATSGLTVGNTTNASEVSTAAFTCAADIPVGTVFQIKNAMTDSDSQTFIALARLRVVG